MAKQKMVEQQAQVEEQVEYKKPNQKMIGQSIVFVDPISLQRNLAGKIISIFTRAELELIGMKVMIPKRSFIRKFCEVKKNRMSRRYIRYRYLHKNVLVLTFQGENAIEKTKMITGKMRKTPGWNRSTIRGIFFGGLSSFFPRIYENVVQIPKDTEEATKLIKLAWQEQVANGAFLRPPPIEGEECTLVTLKPEVTERKLVGKIIDDLRRPGIKLVGAKIIVPTKEQIEILYRHLEGKRFYKTLFEHMMGNGEEEKKIILLVYQGKNGAIERIRDLIGHKDPEKADAETVRGAFGKSLLKNMAHATKDEEELIKEIAIWDRPAGLLAPIVEAY